MTREHSDRIAIGHSPHSYDFVTATAEDISTIGMEGYTIHILVVADKHSKICNVICPPETSCSIMRSREEVQAVRSPCDIPDRVVVSLVDDKARPSI